MKCWKYWLIAAFAFPALLSCSGTDQGKVAASQDPASSARLAGTPSIAVYATADCSGTAQIFSATDNRRLRDLNNVQSPDGPSWNDRIRCIEFSSCVWVYAFDGANYEGATSYGGWSCDPTPLKFPNGWLPSSLAVFPSPGAATTISLVARGYQPGAENKHEKKKYVTANHNEPYSTLKATADAVGNDPTAGSWETFVQISLADSDFKLFALKATDWDGHPGKYVQVKYDDSHLPLMARGDDIGPWEVFRGVDLGRGPPGRNQSWKRMHFYSVMTNLNTLPVWATGFSGPPLAVTGKPDGEADSMNSTHDFIVEWVNPPAEDAPLFAHPYAADPSAHLFDGKIYIYPSHDVDEANDNEDDFPMKDYHVYRMDSIGSRTTDLGVVMTVGQGAAAWAASKMWAPDAAYSPTTGKYYLYFPAKDSGGIFHIGVGESVSPAGPFNKVASLNDFIVGTFSMDPAVLDAGNGDFYLYFGGDWGGQAQCWKPGNPWTYDSACDRPVNGPLVAKLNSDMVTLAETPREAQILDGNGQPATDVKLKYFEAPWVNKVVDEKGTRYYLSYSTGPSGNVWLAWSTSPYGPFTAIDDGQDAAHNAGCLLSHLNVGWTSHSSVMNYSGNYYLFYHDAQLSPGCQFGGACQIDKRSIMYKKIAFPR